MLIFSNRLSTIRNADRIAVIADGKVREIGTHNELMQKEHGHYRRLQMFQDLDMDQVMKDQLRAGVKSQGLSTTKDALTGAGTALQEKSLDDIDKDAKKNAKRARTMGREDRGYFIIGTIGACLAGLVFPGMGKCVSS